MNQFDPITEKTLLTSIGEEISLELAVEMVKNFRKDNQNDVKSYFIGKEILQKILNQPGCAGIEFHNAYNEVGQKTLVYLALDSKAAPVLNFISVNEAGHLEHKPAIVADRLKIGQAIDDDFGWQID